MVGKEKQETELQCWLKKNQDKLDSLNGVLLLPTWLVFIAGETRKNWYPIVKADRQRLFSLSVIYEMYTDGSLPR